MVKIFTKYFFLCFFGVTLVQVVVGEEFSVTMTAYSSTRSQTDSTPFITSTNQRVRSGIVAASRDLLASNLPYGSKLRVVAIEDARSCGGWDPGMTLEVQDTMHPRKHNHVDLWLPSTAKARKWGRCKVTVEVLDSSGETFVQTPTTPEEQSIVEEVIDSNLQLDLEQSQQSQNLFIEAANKVSVASFDFTEVINVESSVLVESTITNTPTYDVNSTPNRVLAEASDIDVLPASNSNLDTLDTIQGKALAEASSTAPTYDANLNSSSASRATTYTYSAPKQQSLMELASQAFLIPLLQFAFSTPNTSEEMLNNYARYYMQNSP